MTRRQALIHALQAADLPVSFASADEARAAYTRLADEWIEKGIIPSESYEQETDRLRARIHDIVDDAQRRFAPYVSRCEKFDVWSSWAREHFARLGDETWVQGSQANRDLIVGLMEERDQAREEVRQLKIDRYSEALDWLCEGDNYALMNEYAPETMRRLRRVLRGLTVRRR